MKSIQLYTYQTPNGHKASIMLEETDLPYKVQLVDIETGDQHRPDVLALNPNNKIPVIVDPDRNRTVFESGAILFYLADRSGVLQPEGPDERPYAAMDLVPGRACRPDDRPALALQGLR
jgi:GST-like protein